MSSKTSKPTHESPKVAAHETPHPPPVEPPAELNLGSVHPEAEAPKHAVQRLHMDQIDAVATPQGVVLFCLTEGGDIWELTTFSGQPEWHLILTPEVPAEEA